MGKAEDVDPLFCCRRFFSFVGQGFYVAGRGVPGSGGVDIGKVQLMLKARPLQGMRVDPVTGARRKVCMLAQA